MNKTIVSLLIVSLFPVFVLAAPKIKESDSVISKDELKEKIGLIEIDFKVPGKDYFELIMKSTREGIIEDPNKTLAVKNNEVAYLESFRSEREKCLMFRIKHIKPIHRKKGGVSIVFTDARGKPVKYSLLDTTIKWTGEWTSYEQVFLIKPEKELIKENYTEDAVPLKIVITFMDTQKKAYTLIPK